MEIELIGWGSGLIVVALALFFLETQISGTGLFGLGGAVCLVLGAFLLSGGNAFVVGGAAIISLVSVALTIRAMYEARKSGKYASPTDPKRLIGQVGVTTTTLDPQGSVRVAGEQWSAITDGDERISENDSVIVSDVDGLVLTVFKADDS